jgi:hypothetical protein
MIDYITGFILACLIIGAGVAIAITVIDRVFILPIETDRYMEGFWVGRDNGLSDGYQLGAKSCDARYFELKTLCCGILNGTMNGTDCFKVVSP